MQRFGSPTPLSQGEVARRKKRRYLSRSDEEIESELDDRKLTYRHGWPLLPPLPVRTITRGAKLSVEDAAKHLETVQNILTVQRVQFYDTYFAYRVPNSAGHDVQPETFLTLVITVNTAMSITFVTPIIQLRQYMKKQEATMDLFIELIDYRAIDDLFTFPILPKELAILEAWSSVSDTVESVISTNQHRWLSIELLHRGLIEHRCSPTVVITTPSAEEDAWWKVIIPAIRLRLRNIVPLFDVEVLCSTTLTGCRKSETVSASSYQKQVLMGSSIGISNDVKHVATVGGFVTLGNGRTYGLTNHHVVRDGFIDGIIKATNENMLRPGDTALLSKPQRFESPPECDHRAFLDQLKEKEKTWEVQRNKGDTRATSELSKIQDDRNTAFKFSREFGSLFASSGPRLTQRPEFLPLPGSAQLKGKATSSEVNFLLDWALLEVAPSRSVENRLPSIGMRLNGTSTHLVEGQFCNTWTPLNSAKTHVKRDEVEVGKYGRTTGWTFGTISCALTKINPQADASYEDTGKVYGLDSSTVGSCYSIVRRGKSDFVDSGDSGSVIVHDDTGTWVGLLFGESASRSGLMLPMDLVMKDIEKVTGLAVTGPKLDLNPS